MQSDEYIFEKILGKKKFKNQVKYLIKWQEYPIEQSTWEPMENLQNIKNWVEEYEEQLKKKKAIEKNCESFSPSISEKKKERNMLKSKELSKRAKRSMNNEENIQNMRIINNDSQLEIDIKVEHNLEIDKPKCILSASCTNNQILFFVEWEIRSEGIQPEKSYVNHEFMKENYPRLLADFYEKRIKFINKD